MLPPARSGVGDRSVLPSARRPALRSQPLSSKPELLLPCPSVLLVLGDALLFGAVHRGEAGLAHSDADAFGSRFQPELDEPRAALPVRVQPAKGHVPRWIDRLDLERERPCCRSACSTVYPRALARPVAPCGGFRAFISDPLRGLPLSLDEPTGR